MVKELIKRGRNVRCLVRNVENAKVLLGGFGCELVQGDVTDKDSVERTMQGCSVVFHISGIPEKWVPDPIVFHQVHAIGTVNVVRKCAPFIFQQVEAALKWKVTKFIYTSTIDVFASEPGSIGALLFSQVQGKSSMRTQPLILCQRLLTTKGPNRKQTPWLLLR